ncbi:MAG TPA: efflux RND transporter periplasmic adaptor subunit [Ignavibacteriaceae bacterium]|nr:efflux RND transporter periplasmic adaptor subunit [Ignavibacteriaceae bacterium]
MRKKKNTVFIVTGIIITFIIVVFLRLQSDSAESGRRPVSVPSVKVGKITRGDIVKTESLTGDILPIQQANIYSKVSGNIEKIFVDIGDKVQKNQLLALVDATIYSQNAKQVHASYIQAKANYENAKLNYERNKTLLSQNLISQQDLDNSRTANDVAFAQSEAANANYSNALTQLSYCRITAPFSGYITKRFLDPGTYVTSSTSSSSSTLFTLMDLNNLKAIINLPENDVPLIPQVIGIQVIADALPGKTFNAKLKKISEAVDLSTRTMAIEVDIENPGKSLKPGMFATINIVLGKKTNTTLLPNDVVLNDQNGDFVFVVNNDNTVNQKYVKLGIQHNNQDEILSGLNENDRIVFVGQTLIKNGSKVKIVK